MRAWLPGIFAKSAITAIVAAKRRQRNKNFLREADGASLPSSAERTGGGEQVLQRSAKRDTDRAAVIERLIVKRSSQRSFDGRAHAGRREFCARHISENVGARSGASLPFLPSHRIHQNRHSGEARNLLFLLAIPGTINLTFRMPPSQRVCHKAQPVAQERNPRRPA